MILRDDLAARRHMLQGIGHEEPSSKPEPYQYVEHRAEQPRKRRALVGSGSGSEPKRRHNGRLVGSPCLTLALRRFGPMYACGHIDSFMTRRCRSLPEVVLWLGIYLTSAFAWIPAYQFGETAGGPNPLAIVGRPISPVLLGTVTSLCAYSQSYCASRATGNAGWFAILYFDVVVSVASAACL